MQDRLMVALDVDDREKALLMRDKVGASVGWLKAAACSRTEPDP